MSSRIISLLISLAAFGGAYFYLTGDDLSDRQGTSDDRAERGSGDGLFGGLPQADDVGESEGAKAEEKPVEIEKPEIEVPKSKVTRQWLVGAWVFEGDYCAGDTGVNFAENGEYSQYETSGTWTLSGEMLSTQSQKFDESVPIGNPKTDTAEVSYVNQNEALIGGDRWRRCPEGRNVVEPWYPDRRFDTF